MDFFTDFRQERVLCGEVEINYRIAGSGPPVRLLHGYPQTHACWQHVAPLLARDYTVVCADLRGYGDSSKPPGLADHSNYSKRAMAADMVRLMSQLGFERFHLVGHDRGGRVSHRLALDHEHRVQTLAVLDISPTLKMFESTHPEFPRIYYHWFLMLQPAPLPEQLLAGHVPMNLLNVAAVGGLTMAGTGAFSPEAMAEYVRVFADPAAIHASCEDYRASGTIDLEHDRADRAAGRKLQVPTLVLWGARGGVARLFDCLGDWREVASHVQGEALPCGHFVPEEAPAETHGAVRRFLQDHPL